MPMSPLLLLGQGHVDLVIKSKLKAGITESHHIQHISSYLVVSQRIWDREQTEGCYH